MTTHIATPAPVSWETVVTSLAAQNIAVQMRLIDGQLAFPHEQPPAQWRELRVAWDGRMVTVQRREQGIDLVCWGNADAQALAFRDALAQAFTQAGSKESSRG